MNGLEEAGSLLENSWCSANLERDGKYCSAGAIGFVNGIENMTGNHGMDNDVAYNEINALPETVALADEIVESGWLRRQYDEDRTLQTVYESFETYRDRLDYIDIVTAWNDDHEAEQLPEILETFKYAAKRLDA